MFDKLFKRKKKNDIKFSKKFISLVVVMISALLIILIIDYVYAFKNKTGGLPVITLLGEHNVYLKVGEKYNEPNAKADDGTGKNISKNIEIKGSVDVSKEGVYFIYYNVLSKYGVKAKEVIRRVVVGDINSNEEKLQSQQGELKEIIRIVINDYKEELLQFGTDQCKKTDFLTPMINSYYEEGEEPERETLRPLVKEILEEEGE